MTERRLLLPRQLRSAEVQPASFDAAANTVDVIWTTGATVARMSWRDGPYDEELVVTKASVLLDRLNSGAPFLNTHNDFSLSGVMGSVVPGSARIEGGRGLAKIKLSAAADVADAVQKVREGTVRNISVGYAYHRVEKVDREGQVPLWRVTLWEPMELSAVPIPADPGAQVRAAPATAEHEAGDVPARVARFLEAARAIGTEEATRAGEAVRTRCQAVLNEICPGLRLGGCGEAAAVGLVAALDQVTAEQLKRSIAE